MSVSLNLTQDQLQEICEWFDTISVPQEMSDGTLKDVITIKKLITFLDLKKYHKRNFHYPSYMEIMKEAENLTQAINNIVLTKDQIIYMMNKWVIIPNIKHEMKLAFGVFDTEKRNFLDIDEVQVIVTNYGDAFNDAELHEMLRDANTRGDGNVFYDDFVESLFSVAPELWDLEVEYLYENPEEDPSVPPDPVIVEEPEQPPPPPPKKKQKKK